MTTQPADPFANDDTLAAPPALLQPYGVVKDIADWIDRRSRYKCRPLATAAALACMATVCGRRYAHEDGMRAALYMIGVAESGYGKEAGRQSAIKLLARAGLEQRVGTGDFASETGLVVQLRDCPVRMFPLDEFGRMLAGFTSKNAGSHERQIVSTLMKLWGNAGRDTFLGKAYAEKPAIRIEEPHAVLYATTTAEQFWRAVQGSDVVDGVMSRLLIIPVDGARGQWRETSPGDSEPPKALIDTVKMLAKGPPMGDLANIDSSESQGTHAVVVMSPEAQDASTRVRETADALALKDPTQLALWRRAHEQTLRLALVAAVSSWPAHIDACRLASLEPSKAPTIQEMDILWAWSIVRWSTRRMCSAVRDLVADSDEERTTLAIIKAARRGGIDGVSRRDLTRALQRVPRAVREAAIRTALESGQVVMHTRPHHGYGRPGEWFALPTAEDDQASSLADDGQ